MTHRPASLRWRECLHEGNMKVYCLTRMIPMKGDDPYVDRVMFAWSGHDEDLPQVNCRPRKPYVGQSPRPLFGALTHNERRAQQRTFRTGKRW